jgi:pyridinium-3,5-biscarboxylic acid mononucleotide sulfurtransferase
MQKSRNIKRDSNFVPAKTISISLDKKLTRLRSILRRTGGCAVAFSGGVDSSVLLAAARETLGDRCLAVIGVSALTARHEREAALAWLRRAGIPHRILRTQEMQDPKFTANPEDRCFYCKRRLFIGIRRLAAAGGLAYVAEGSNRDDRAQIRPGRRALAELGILRPLDQAGLGKSEIRELARKVYRIPIADKPSTPCLATRVAFGVPVTTARLRQAEAMEEFLHGRGFKICRARIHPGLLRLELGPGEERRLLEPKLRRACIAQAKKLGFAQVTLDLQGYRSGSGHEMSSPRKRGSRN